MQVTIEKQDGTPVITKDIARFAIFDTRFTVLLLGGLVNLGLQKGTVCNVTITDNDGVTTVFTGSFLSYQFCLQNYQQRQEDGTTLTVNGVTDNTVTFETLV